MFQSKLDAGPPTLTITELNLRVRKLLEEDPELRDVWVRGEVSNWRGPHSSGHAYFRLKDDGGEVDAVMWRGDLAGLAFDPQEGLEVLARGAPTVYEVRGRYQFVVREMVPAGEGALWLRYLQLKAKLDEEGLFEPARKRPLPGFTTAVGVVTSKGGAALRDVLDVLGRRSPHVEVVVAHARVQGEGAADTVASAIDRLDRYAAGGKPLDVVIVCRGGGSLEDLWAFNEEATVRAIAACGVPVISGVGHQTDTTLADLAADVRAPTPSAAAELAAQSRVEATALVDGTRNELAQRLGSRLRLESTRIEGLAQRPVLTRPEALLSSAWQTTDELTGRLPRGMRAVVDRASASLAKGASTLDALSPLKVLGRGYAVATIDGRVVRSIARVKTGDAMDVRVSDGRIEAQVNDTREDGS